MTWATFLREIADEFGLSPGQTEIFLIRWSEENKEKTDTEVQNDIPKETDNYIKCKKAIFKKFEFGKQQPNGCKTLEDAGPQKGKRLLKWLEEKYREWLQAHPEPEGKTDRSVQSSDDIDWLRVCREMWAKQRENQRLRRKVTERGFEVNVYVGLGLVQRVQQQRREGEMDRDEIFALTDTEAIAHTYEHDRFLDEVIGKEPRGENRHIAIIGEPGAGKSTLLAAIANYLTKDESNRMPICLSLAGLQGKTIKDYLLDIWLSEALKLAYPEIAVVEDSHKISFQQWLRQGQVWLLLDGLDEISDRTPAEVQNDIKNELTDWLGYVRVALTCRLNVWDARLNNDLTGFDTYKTDKFKPDEIKKFIEDWFKQAKKPKAGQILQNKLDESKYTNLRGLVTNPLRLSLLCQVFYRNPNLELPETKAGLYEIFVRNFYEDWKAEQHPISDSELEQSILNEALGKLALAGLDNQDKLKRFRLPKQSAREVMTDDLFELAENLGWLNIVDRDANDKAVYAFWHQTFQEYFAALAVDNWDYFLPQIHVDRPVKGKEYRIFQPQWEEVILFWLGRSDVSDKEKEAFIEKLVNFNDGFAELKHNGRGLYEYRAYFLAAAGMSEFKTCSRGDVIVKQLLNWAFGDLNQKNQDCEKYKKSNHVLLPEIIQKESRKNLPDSCIKYLIEFIEKIDKNKISRPRIELINALRVIQKIGIHDSSHVSKLQEIINNSIEDKLLLIEELGSLANFYPLAEKYLTESIKSAEKSQDLPLLIKLVEILTKVQITNTEILNILEKLLNHEDPDICLKTANCLSIIKPQNPQIFKSIIKFLKIPKINISHSLYDRYGIYQHFLNLENQQYERKLALEIFKNLFLKSEDINNLQNIIKQSPEDYLDLIEAIFEKTIQNNDLQDITKNFLNLLLSESSNNLKLASFLICRIMTIDPECSTIDQLVYLLDLNNELVCNYTISYLEKKIDYFSTEAKKKIKIKLINIIQNHHDFFIKIKIAYVLWKIQRNNYISLKNLEEIIQVNHLKLNHKRLAAEYLYQINPDSKMPFECLLNAVLTLFKTSRKKGFRYDIKLERLLFATLITVINDNQQYIEFIKNLKPSIINLAENSTKSYYHNIYEILWNIAQKLAYPDFYHAWYGETSPFVQTLESQINSSLQLQPTATTYPLCLDIKIFSDETDTREIAQELANKIFEKIAPNELIPTIKIKSDLKRELANLTISLQVEKIALMFDLRGLEIDPDFKQSALYEIALWLANSPKISIAWISDAIANHPLNIDPPMRGFTSEPDNLLEVLQNWLNDV